MTINALLSCATVEIEGISFENSATPEELLELATPQALKMGSRVKMGYPPFVIFTHARRGQGSKAHVYAGNHGENLRDYIHANGLGTVIQTEERVNWTNNLVTLFVWLPDYPALEAWHAQKAAAVQSPV